MIKQNLLLTYGPIPEDLLKEVLDMTTLDIKANRYMFNKRTSLQEAVIIAGMCLHVLNTRILHRDNYVSEGSMQHG